MRKFASSVTGAPYAAWSAVPLSSRLVAPMRDDCYLLVLIGRTNLVVIVAKEAASNEK